MAALQGGVAMVLGYTTPEHVTHWGARIALTIGVLVIIGLALWGMRRGWQHRGERQQHLPAPALVPSDPATVLHGPVAASYLATTSAGQWLDRIVVHSLGVPAQAQVAVRADGVCIERTGEDTLFITLDQLDDVHLDRGIAGEVYEAGSVVIITWLLGDTLLDTGLRPHATSDVVPLAVAVRALIDSASTQPPSTASTEGAS